MKTVFIAFVIFHVMCSICISSGTGWYEGEGMALIGQSPGEAHRKAHEMALRNAMEKACGIEVQAQAFLKISEIENSFKRYYDQLFRTSILATVKDQEILVDEVYYPNKSKSAHHRIKLKAYVIPDTIKIDPAFQIDIELSKKVYIPGDKLEMIISLSRPAYVTLFQFYDNDLLRILLPIPPYSNNLISITLPEKFEYPPKVFKLGVTPWSIQVPLLSTENINTVTKTDFIIAVAVKIKGYDISQKVFTDSYDMISSASFLRDFNAFLSRIPSNMRTYDVVSYMVEN